MAVVAEFIADKTRGTEPLAVQFTDLSTGSPDTWLWVFGATTTVSYFNTPDVIFLDTADVVWFDTSYGIRSSDQHPLIVFETVGVFDVSLTATLAGDSDEELKEDYIVVIDSVIARPKLLQSGVAEAYFADGWENDKHWFVSQGEKAYPCAIQFVDIYCDTTNE